MISASAKIKLLGIIASLIQAHVVVIKMKHFLFFVLKKHVIVMKIAVL